MERQRAQIRVLVAWWGKKMKKSYGVIEKRGSAVSSWALKIKLADSVKFPPPAVASCEEIRDCISDMEFLEIWLRGHGHKNEDQGFC